MYKKTVARYDSRCIHCGSIIPKGKKVQWFKGVGIRHEKCGQIYTESKTLESNAEEEPRNIVERQHISRVGKLLKNVEPVGPTGSGGLKNKSQSSTFMFFG